MRHLATIQRIERIDPIEGRDRIGLAKVEGWRVIVALDQFKAGDLCVYVEIDSVLPEHEEFEFLRSKKFRIRTMKMAGVYSEGICFPMSILPVSNYPWEIGDDVTELLGIRKYDEYGDEAPPAKPQKPDSWLRGFLFRHRITRPLARLLYSETKRERDGFPPEVSKTDETRIQNLPYEELLGKDLRYEVREKLDGQSATYLLRKRRWPFRNEFVVCSRNIRLTTPDDSSYWQMAEKYHIREALEELIDGHAWICLQGEIIGPGIQGNPYALSERALYGFNLIWPEGKEEATLAEARMRAHGIPWVPMIDGSFALPLTCDKMVRLADGVSKIAPVAREGLVLRNYAKHISFKAVSQAYLVGHGK